MLLLGSCVNATDENRVVAAVVAMMTVRIMKFSPRKAIPRRYPQANLD